MEPHEIGGQPVPVAERCGAQPGFASCAGRTGSARRDPREDDEIADPVARSGAGREGSDRDVGRTLAHTRSEFLDDRGTLVAEHHAGRPFPVPVDHVEIGVADTRAHHAHPDLAGTRRVEPEILDGRWARGTVEDQALDRAAVRRRRLGHPTQYGRGLTGMRIGGVDDLIAHLGTATVAKSGAPRQRLR
jgi:hypothetical protein